MQVQASILKKLFQSQHLRHYTFSICMFKSKNGSTKAKQKHQNDVNVNLVSLLLILLIAVFIADVEQLNIGWAWFFSDSIFTICFQMA